MSKIVLSLAVVALGLTATVAQAETAHKHTKIVRQAASVEQTEAAPMSAQPVNAQDNAAAANGWAAYLMQSKND